MFSQQPCILLSATVQVHQNMCFVTRTDPKLRLADYKSAFSKWLDEPSVESMVFVENSAFDLSEFKAMADKYPHKLVEFLSFQSPLFDGSRGKGYGEMICLQFALNHSNLLRQSSRFLKVSGRYHLKNATAIMAYVSQHPELDVICNLSRNLSWADSRAFGGTIEFLERYLCPMHDLINDSAHSYFEHVLAKAAHHLMADGGKWSMSPAYLEIDGVSGTHNETWKRGPLLRLRLQLRHRLHTRLLANSSV